MLTSGYLSEPFQCSHIWSAEQVTTTHLQAIASLLLPQPLMPLAFTAGWLSDPNIWEIIVVALGSTNCADYTDINLLFKKYGVVTMMKNGLPLFSKPMMTVDIYILYVKYICWLIDF